MITLLKPDFEENNVGFDLKPYMKLIPTVMQYLRKGCVGRSKYTKDRYEVRKNSVFRYKKLKYVIKCAILIMKNDNIHMQGQITYI